MIYAAGPISEHIAYATGPTATGPWTFGNTLMPTQGRSFTNHPGVIDYKGNTYLFYHNGALPDGGGFHRSVCVEQIKFNEDGSIPEVNMTKEGAPQAGSFNPYKTVEAETICWESGIETYKNSDGGMYVGDIDNKDYIKVKGVDFGIGAASFKAKVSSETNGGNIELRLDSTDGKLIGACAVVNTNGSQNWVTSHCAVKGAEGKHDLYLVFTGSEGKLFNFDTWQFSK
jgi:arabinoxylan arabinofuranohydrolase